MHACQPIDECERREAQRFDLSLPVVIQSPGRSQTLHGVSSDLSDGGICLNVENGREIREGEVLDLQVQIPGQEDRSLSLQGEVRWMDKSKRKIGFRFAEQAKTQAAAFLAAALAFCIPDVSNAAVPSFDPNGPVDLDKYQGGERPNQQAIMTAFESQYDAFDRCIDQVRQGDKTVEGMAEVQVLLNPDGDAPLGVNAQLTNKSKKAKKLRTCIRNAVAQAPYPSYDGPPVVVEFEFELDPGYDVVEEE